MHSKNKMFSFHYWVILFSFECPCMIRLKENNMQRTEKQKNQNAFKYGCKRVSRRCGSYMMYLEGDGPHQTVMIVCGCNWSSCIITLHMMIYSCFLAKVSHTTRVFFAIPNTIVQIQCDLAITRNTCGSICSLNCLNLFLK